MSIIKDNLLYPKEDKVWDDYLKTDEDTSFATAYLNAINQVVEEKGDRPFLINGGMALGELGFTTSKTNVGPKQVMLSELDPMSQRLASILYQHGLRRGDVCQMVWPNTSVFQVALLAIWHCEAVPSLSDHTLNINFLALQMEATGPKVILATAFNLSKVSAALKIWGKTRDEVKIIVLGPSGSESKDYPNFEGLMHSRRMFPPVPKQGPFLRESLGAIFWSSGTTGRPKGIQQTFNLFINHVRPNKIATGKLIQSTCFFHIGGCITPMHTVFHDLEYFFTGEDLSPDSVNLLYAVDQFKPSFMAIGTHHCNQMMTHGAEVTQDLDLTSVELVGPLGTNVHPGINSEVLARFPNCKGCLNLYTMSELGNIVAVNPSHSALGPVAPGNVVRIVNPETGKTLGPHQVGEIQVKSRFTMKGYVDSSEDSNFFGPDGFCHTGDNGHFDENGILYFDSRLKDLIKYDNKHVYPGEIETVIQKHPDVLEVCVFGKPDPLVIDWVMAAVLLAPGSSLTEDDIKAMVAKEVDEYKQVKGGVIFVKDRLPRNEQGKILRKEMINLL